MSDSGAPILALAALGLLLVRVRVHRMRLEQVARAEHELRGAATALALACESWRRQPDTGLTADGIEVQLDRLCAGLADLQAARGGQAPAAGQARVDLDGFLGAALAPWRAVLRPVTRPAPPVQVVADRGRLAQALGNLIANAAEHGRGGLEVRTRPTAEGVRLELRNPRGRGGPQGPGRGRGLAIAERATRELGGTLEVHVEGDEVVAALDLPRAA